MVRLCYIGSDDFSADVLRRMAKDERVRIDVVVTYPDLPTGRGHRVAPTPVKVEAMRLGADIVEVSDVGDPEIHRLISSFGFEVAVLVSFRILPPEFLRIFPKGIVNLHPSLLPDLRGAAPVNWAIMLGYRRSGLTTFVISEELDAGDVLLQEEFEIGPDETAGEVFSRIAAPGARLLVESVLGYISGELVPRPQEGVVRHRAPRIVRKHRIIRWGWDAERVHNRIRGLSPKPAAIATFDGKVVRLLRSKLVPDCADGEPGAVVDVSDEGIVVRTGRGAVLITHIQPEGRRVMAASEFARGYIRGGAARFGEAEL